VTLDLRDLPVSDSFQVGAPTETPARATLHMEWRTGHAADNEQSVPLGFKRYSQRAVAHIDFSASGQTSATDSTPFTFQSNAQGQQTVFALIGREANGMFLPNPR
jgi:hypothetical protein